MIGSRGQRILLDRRLLAEPSAGHLKIAGLVSFSAGENKSNLMPNFQFHVRTNEQSFTCRRKIFMKKLCLFDFKENISCLL